MSHCVLLIGPERSLCGDPRGWGSLQTTATARALPQCRWLRARALQEVTGRKESAHCGASPRPMRTTSRFLCPGPQDSSAADWCSGDMAASGPGHWPELPTWQRAALRGDSTGGFSLPLCGTPDGTGGLSVLSFFPSFFPFFPFFPSFLLSFSLGIAYKQMQSKGS